MKTNLRLALCATLAVLVVACAPRRPVFEPAEAATAVSPEGYTAAHYTLFTDVGRVGEAKVWSRGAYTGDVRGEPRTVLHVGVEVENYSWTPIRVSPGEVFLDWATVGQRVVRDIPVTSIVGPDRVQPEAVEQIDLYFVLPRRVTPDAVNAFRVNWTIRNGEIVYRQRTPFLEAPHYYAGATPYYYSPFYDPFYRDPFFYRPRAVIIHRRPFVHVHRVPRDGVHIRRYPRG